jgi:hypothetical protein
MFEEWVVDVCGYRTLHHVDRCVQVDTAKAFATSGSRPRRRDEISMWKRAGGISISAPYMRARQIAWIMRDTGEWWAVVLMPVASGNGLSRITMQLWLEPDMIVPLGDG